ncbi:protein-export chaperone SecB [Massilia sp. AB1]|uniref:protein-export chaperone SecB n=1 Tax=Massilia sp. AB1 TaxID=2823371 RepID=UPI001B82CBB2|nr:protein-export chaperone SecB [Massilia sp. AB1]MBQ5941769.1 protein-export chaperone SecB [Massilia sp. AB1]
MLQIRPQRFFAKHVEFGVLEELELGLDGTDLALSVEAVKSKESESSVIIHLQLRTIVNDGMGIRVHYCAEFEVADSENSEYKVTDDTLRDTFMQVNAPAIAYPYLRSFVSIICVNAGQDPTILPPVNFQALFNKRKSDKKIDEPIRIAQ